MEVKKKPLYVNSSEKELELELEKVQKKILENKVLPTFPLLAFHEHYAYLKSCINVGADPNGIGACFLSLLSVCVGPKPKFLIENLELSGFLNLWIMCIAKSGTGKGQTQKRIFTPVMTDIEDYLDKNELDLTLEVIDIKTLYTDILRKNSHGVFVNKEEMYGWFTAMDKFGEAPEWLQIFDGKARKKHVSKTRISVEYTYVNIYGEIQPKYVDYIMQGDRLENGMISRLLMCNNKLEKPMELDFTNKFDFSLQEKFKKSFMRIWNYFYSPTFLEGKKSNFFKLTVKNAKFIQEIQQKHRKKYSAYTNVESFINRYNLYAYKISALLQILENEAFYNSLIENLEITDQNVNFALEICDFFLECFVWNLNASADPLMLKLSRALKQGVTLRKFALIEKVDPSNLNKKKLMWEKEYPTFF